MTSLVWRGDLVVEEGRGYWIKNEFSSDFCLYGCFSPCSGSAEDQIKDEYCTHESIYKAWNSIVLCLLLQLLQLSPSHTHLVTRPGWGSINGRIAVLWLALGYCLWDFLTANWCRRAKRLWAMPSLNSWVCSVWAANWTQARKPFSRSLL